MRDTALAITRDERARRCMCSVFEASQRKLRLAKNESEARAALAGKSIPVVIIDDDTVSSSWRELMEQMLDCASTPEPKFIIVSRLADDRLWAEVLNLGGYDLLAKPLAAEEVAWVVRSALSCRSRSGAAEIAKGASN